MSDKQINVIEIDSRDARYQSGIARYFDVLAQNLPSRVSMFRVIFYHSPDFKDVRMTLSDEELSVYTPAGFPMASLFDAALAYIGAKVSAMQNLIVKSDCLGCEGFAYLLRSRFYCKTMGVLHCLPHRSHNGNGGFPPNNPFFNMDHVVVVCDHGVEFLQGVRNNRPFSVIYNGIKIPKIDASRPRDDTFRFIFANGWAEHKGLSRILPAIRTVARRHKIEVLVLGGTHANNKLLDEIADLPIRNLGLITDPVEIAKCYEMSDCALFASYSEACSFAGIEAMAYNLPIISTPAAGLQEMFANAAIYVNLDANGNIDTGEYARRMMEIIQDKKLRTKLGVLGYARYLKRYTAKKMIADTVDLYDRLVAC